MTESLDRHRVLEYVILSLNFEACSVSLSLYISVHYSQMNMKLRDCTRGQTGDSPGI